MAVWVYKGDKEELIDPKFLPDHLNAGWSVTKGEIEEDDTVEDELDMSGFSEEDSTGSMSDKSESEDSGSDLPESVSKSDDELELQEFSDEDELHSMEDDQELSASEEMNSEPTVDEEDISELEKLKAEAKEKKIKGYGRMSIETLKERLGYGD